MFDKKTISAMTVKIGANTTGFKKGLSTTKKHTSAFQKQLSSLKNSLQATFGIVGVAAIGSVAKSSVELAAKAEGIEKAFNKLNKPNLLAELKAATRGTVDEVTLMQKAVQAKNFKIPLEQLATYFKFATNRAIETGESVDYLVDSIITGIGRKSVLVMDNLGISAVELQEETKRVGDFGAAAGVIIQRELQKAGEVVDSTATKFARLNAEMQNLKRDTGSWLLENSGILRGYTRFKDISEANLSTWKKLNLAFGESKRELAAYDKIFEGLQDKQREAREGAASVAAFEMAMFGGKAEEELKKASEGIKKVFNELDYSAAKAKNYNAFAFMPVKSDVSFSGGGLEPEVDLHDNLGEFMRQTRQTAAEVAEEINEISQELNTMLSSMFADAISLLAEGFGKLLTGGLGDMKSSMRAILDIFGQFAQKMGKLLIAYGVSMKAFKKAFKEPIGAIITGAALVAIGAAISSLASKGPDVGGSGYGGSYGGGVQSIAGRATDPYRLEGKFTINGTDLVLVYDRNKRFMNQ